jgi:hypothetical protein
MQRENIIFLFKSIYYLIIDCGYVAFVRYGKCTNFTHKFI